METEGPHTDNGSTKGPPGSNVVPFPRDWLGPRDELVPLGRPKPPPAGTGSSDLAGLSQQARSGSAPSAADFWGEEAAALHDAVQAPDADRPDHDPPEPGGGGQSTRVEIGKHFHATQTRVAAALAVALVALAFGAAFATRSGGPRTQSPPAQGTDRVTMFATLVAGTAADLSAVRQIALHRWPPMRRAHRPAGGTNGHVAAVAPPRVVSSEPTPSAPAATSTPTATANTSNTPASPSPGYTATADTATSAQPVSSPAPQAATTRSPSQSVGTSTSGSSSPRSESTTSSSSQPAFGAQGTLGPGSSPNG